MNEDLFFTIAGYIFILPVCIGLIRWGALDQSLRVAWLNPLLALVITVGSQITASLNIYNHFLYYWIAIIGTLCYLLFYLQLVRPPGVRKVMVAGTILIVLMVIADIFKWGMVDFASASFIVSDILLIGLSLWVMQNYDLTRPVSIVNWALFMYLLADLTYTLVSPFLYNYLNNDFLTLMIFGITPFFNIIRACMFTYAFWIQKDAHPPDFSDIQGLKSKPT